ncbi:nucleoporin NUP145-like isoform X1 [Diprion similis]|uniref:nucleoporin NUP145-like isoform X1 n=1 Tax=Diprion similis TaxID=362088 RepID=UPI001EF89CEE|nr:nucleoporin NUP145-like isoform X1 [Diprion similis]
MGVNWICALFCLLAIANIAIEATASKPEASIRERRSLNELDSEAASMVRKKRGFAYTSTSSNLGTGGGTSQTVTSGGGTAVVSSSSSGNPSAGGYSYTTRSDPDNPGQVIYTYTDSSGKQVTGRAPAESIQSNVGGLPFSPYQNQIPNFAFNLQAFVQEYIQSIQAQQQAIQAQIQSFLPKFGGMNNFPGFGVPNFLPNNFPFGGNNDASRNGMNHGPNPDGGVVFTSTTGGAATGTSQTSSGGGQPGGNFYSTSSNSYTSTVIGADGKPHTVKTTRTVINDNGKITSNEVTD